MAPYMMSVGLWVGCLAFCLMYPLTEYKGKLKSGFAWWASKASVLYPVAILQGVLLILLLHVFDGFTPVEMTKTILFAALTGACFTSIMYFFNITFGKVGSFLMLIFMVVQLAGSAGTYPVEISPSFVAKIHYYLAVYLYSKCIPQHDMRRREHPSGCDRSDRTDDHFLNINNPSVQPYGKKKEIGAWPIDI